MKKVAYLIGPFIGELRWEYYYFAPYIIHLMKQDPNRMFVVFTRRPRFDLYGAYADIFVPLKVLNDKPEYWDRFKIQGFEMHQFNMLLKSYIKKYKKRYRIIEKIYPDISRFLYKVKWQFPKDEMDYDFQPRGANRELVDRFVKSHNVFVDESKYVAPLNLSNYETKHSSDLRKQIVNFVDDIKISNLGCFIEALRACEFVIGNLSSDNSRLALLLKKPLIALNEQLTDDEINLINPLNTPVIRCNDVREGVKIYEYYFRLKKRRVG